MSATGRPKGEDRSTPPDGSRVAAPAAEAAPGLVGLVELSSHDRLGVKGPGAADWLASRGLELPPRPNRLSRQADGLVVARLGDTEFAFTDVADPHARGVERLRQALAQDRPPRCHDVPRADSQAAFGLEGDDALPALSMLCAADLRARVFGPGDLLQTRCGGVGAQLWNLSDERRVRVIVLCDSSVARHQRSQLLAALAHARRGRSLP